MPGISFICDLEARLDKDFRPSHKENVSMMKEEPSFVSVFVRSHNFSIIG